MASRQETCLLKPRQKHEQRQGQQQQRQRQQLEPRLQQLQKQRHVHGAVHRDLRPLREAVAWQVLRAASVSGAVAFPLYRAPRHLGAFLPFLQVLVAPVFAAEAMQPGLLADEVRSNSHWDRWAELRVSRSP